ncbi:MAG TPA: hypothetical protein VGL34_16645 [Steroidobacteraceae bacterium]|jgi:hypothetical protein
MLFFNAMCATSGGWYSDGRQRAAGAAAGAAKHCRRFCPVRKPMAK